LSTVVAITSWLKETSGELMTVAGNVDVFVILDM
jgi:hypothetical protein